MRRLLALLLLVPALALGLAACGSDDNKDSGSSSGATKTQSSAQPGKGKPPITIGSKAFTEETILGELYAQALQAKGYTVRVKANVGESEIIDKALKSGDIDAYPEYTGVIVQELQGAKTLPANGLAAYAQAKKFELDRGFTMTKPTPFEDKDALAVKNAFAKEKGLKTVADLKKVSGIKLGGAPAFRNREAGLKGLQSKYGLSGVQFVPLPIGQQYAALDSDKINVAEVFTTDGQLAKGKLTVLDDPKNVFGFQNVAMVINKKALDRQGEAFVGIIDDVSAKLTTEAVQKMNAAVDVDKQQPKAVAKLFLQANGLL